MKTRKISSVIVLVIAFLGFSVLTTGCSTDPCEDVVCLNNGVPTEDGDDCFCACPSGYEGEDCGVEWTTKFLGTYSGNDDCGFTYESTFTKDDFNKLRVSNAGGFQVSITADLTSSTAFNIPNQTDASGRVWSGNGTISASTITLNYVVTFSDGTSDSCSVTYTK
ncbi:MAG: hypothetical protein EA412_12485 [Chitinophagaceae bacterium]|nr:MAG: hypothetical protein EA412_12485 [Chitinophagaceae bacterium]